MHPDLEKLLSRGKIEPKTADELDQLAPGTFCAHKSWGVGKVVDWDRLNVKVVVDFEEKPGHEMGMKFAGMSLTPIAEDSFLAKRFSSPEELQSLASDDPVELVKLALRSQGDRLFLNELEKLIKGPIVPDGKYRGWWENTKKKLREDRQFIVPAKRTEPLELRAEDFDPSERLIEDFNEARDLKAKVKAVDSIIKDISAFADNRERLVELVDEIGDIARKGVKLQYAAAVELLLIREELQSKIKGYEPPDDQITVADIISDDEEALPGLFEELSLTRLRQILKTFPDAFGKEWIDRLLSLFPECNLRSISEIAGFLDSMGKSGALITYMEDGLQQRSLSSDALAWICRERKGLAGTLFNPELSLSIMSSLESDQLNDEGAVRSANRLRDLIVDDKDLIPDLIGEANVNIVRNFASRLINSASFDELTRKSLVARVIKMHPEVQDLVSGEEKKKDDESLIVSEESYAERKQAYDKLVKEEIPQNREDIRVARSYGDLRENFEYKSAKEYQRVLMKRQGDWERDLKIAQPTDFSDPDTSKVSIGTVVKLEPTDGGEPLTYTVLGAWDSDPEKGVIAYLSERATQILNKNVGDEVEFPTAEGATQHCRITSIEPYRK